MVNDDRARQATNPILAIIILIGITHSFYRPDKRTLVLAGSFARQRSAHGMHVQTASIFGKASPYDYYGATRRRDKSAFML